MCKSHKGFLLFMKKVITSFLFSLFISIGISNTVDVSFGQVFVYGTDKIIGYNGNKPIYKTNKVFGITHNPYLVYDKKRLSFTIEKMEIDTSLNRNVSITFSDGKTVSSYRKSIIPAMVTLFLTAVLIGIFLEKNFLLTQILASFIRSLYRKIK